MPTADILAAIGAARRPGQVLVGFAAETGDGLERARAKRERKGVDLIVLNDVSRADIGFEVDDNEVVLVAATGRALARAPKRAIAAAILDRVEHLPLLTDREFAATMRPMEAAIAEERDLEGAREPRCA